MKKTYYKKEYSSSHWNALLSTAADLNCQLFYKNKNAVIIDSTTLEEYLYKSYPKSFAPCGQTWGECIHRIIRKANYAMKQAACELQSGL